MEIKQRHLKLCLLLICSFFSPLVSLNLSIPSRGCYWNAACQDRWAGGCATGHSNLGHSSNCDGSCPEPEYSSCPPPYYTRFYCCIPEVPKVTKDRCIKCSNKVDSGNQYTCCTDCSYPHIISDSGDPKLGYCKTGAELLVEPKSQDTSRVFKWVPGSWKPCSSPCDGGIRSRDVECYAMVEHTLLPDYPVYDYFCSSVEMPATEEPCNLRSCLQLSDAGARAGKHPRIPSWTVALFIFIGIFVIGGTGFALFILHKRRTSIQHGHVYIMMEGYL